MIRARGLYGRLVAAALLCAAAVAAPAMTLDNVAQLARTLASQPYSEVVSPLPAELRSLDYDAYREIRFRNDRALWRDARLPFEVAYFHAGKQFDRPVRIHEVTAQGVREIGYDSADYDFGANKFDGRNWKGVGHAGFRAHFAVNTPTYKDEVLVFLGASYFRALGRGQAYGLSARALALDTAQPGGEEFPRFEQFWLYRPAADAQSLEILALLNSRRVTGAYRFVVRPGVETVIEVRARLFLRDGVGGTPNAQAPRFGLAPLTSMFFFGENQRAPIEDYRPEVHDSDGLAIAAGNGEWLWRPLTNPKRLSVSSFAITSPRGFGLMQRDRTFASYEDLEAHYERRPSAWVEPMGDWGAGRVDLVQIPTPDETHDNIVAYWVPDAAPQPGQPFEFAYRLRWQKERETLPPGAWVTQTRRGHGYIRQRDDSVFLSVDFTGPTLAALPRDAKVTADVSVGPFGQLMEANAYPNGVRGGWRMTLRVKRSNSNLPVELRAFLRSGADALSETWTYLLPPE